MSEASGTLASGSRWVFHHLCKTSSFLFLSELLDMPLLADILLVLCAACSFSSSAGAGSITSDNTDTRALNSIQEG
jgi:hypothetical protein